MLSDCIDLLALGVSVPQCAQLDRRCEKTQRPSRLGGESNDNIFAHWVRQDRQRKRCQDVHNLGQIAMVVE